MNQRTIYEQLIAEKLEQIPFPDNADAIWASIEGQLTILPANDGNTPPSKSSGSGGGNMVGGISFITAIIAVVTGIVIYQQSAINKNQHYAPPAIQKSIIPLKKQLVIPDISPVKINIKKNI